MSNISNLIYHEVIPNNLQSQYQENENVDFDISLPNRKINLGSIRIEGELEVTQGNNFLNAAANASKDIKMDGLVGAHCLFEQIITSISKPQKNIIENLTEYPRYVKMAMAATSGRDDMLNSNNLCELKNSLDAFTNPVLQGVVPPTAFANPIRLNPDFSVRPMFCMNSGMGEASFRQVGEVLISLTLARRNAVLYGNDVDADTQYVIRDLKLRFTSSPDDGTDESIVLKTKLNIKQSIQSSFANVQTRVPAVCNAVTVSFQPQIQENTTSYNNYQLHEVPSLTQTQFLFNDSTNTLISYLIKSVSEVQDRAIDSMKDTGRNALSIQNLVNNNGFLVGLDFAEMIDLSSSKFSLQLTSAINNSIPMLCYMYFHSFVELAGKP